MKRYFLKYLLLPLLVSSAAWCVYDYFTKESTQMQGQIGGVWYSYSSNRCNCGSIVEPKAISVVIREVIDSVEPNWISDVYCITMSHYGISHGTLLVIPDPSLMPATCDDAAYNGSYDMTFKILTAPWRYNSQESVH